MARRRRSNFGSTDAVHRKLAQESVKSARWWLREARRNAAKGACSAALMHLTTAHRMATSAAVHRGSGGSKPLVGRGFYPARTLQAADKRFVAKCVKKRGE